MVHGYMMSKIGLRRMSKKRAYKPCDPAMHPFIFFPEHTAMTHAMEHQSKTPFKIGLGEIYIGNKYKPPKNSLKQGREHDNSPRDNNQVNTRQKMYEWKIPFVGEIL